MIDDFKTGDPVQEGLYLCEMVETPQYVWPPHAFKVLHWADLPYGQSRWGDPRTSCSVTRDRILRWAGPIQLLQLEQPPPQRRERRRLEL